MVPNQKQLRFVNSPKDEVHFYSRYNNQDLIQAQLSLSDSAFRLYIYLGMYREKDKYDLSRVDAMNCTGMSSRSFTNAVNELIKCGYLVPDPLHPNSRSHYVYVEKGIT